MSNTRENHLIELSESYGVDLDTVKMLSEVLGESEDYDGLVTALEDFEDFYDDDDDEDDF